jgi:peptidoglycan/LPS O-acetylase OafA/YrhL
VAVEPTHREARPSAEAAAPVGPVGGYVPSLDGLRGVAIGLVFMHHFFMGWPFHQGLLPTAVGAALGIGWVGVDVFFVLSGFLITGILLDTRDDDGRWRNFMARRALRIFPAYYAALLVNFLLLPRIAQWLTGTPRGFTGGVTKSWPWFFLYASNIRVARPEASFPVSLSVTWSLAIEEQFYLFWPIVIWRLPRRHLLRFLVATLVIVQLVKVGLAVGLGWPIEKATVARIDEFAWGAVPAVMMRGGAVGSRAWGALRTTGLVLVAPVLAALVVRGRSHALPWLLFTNVFVGAATMGCVMACVEPSRAFVKRALERPSLRLIGKHSYAVYLVHAMFWPAFAVADARSTRALTLAEAVRMAVDFGACAVATAFAAAAMYVCIERPALSQKRRFASRGVSPPA